LLFIIPSETFRESFSFPLLCLSALSGIFGLGVYSIWRILKRTLELDFPFPQRFNYDSTLREIVIYERFCTQREKQKALYNLSL